LRRLAVQPHKPASAPVDTAAAEEHCELCGAALPPEHRHLLDLKTRSLLCACRPCSLLFDRPAAGGGHYRLLGDRRLSLDDFVLDDAVWERLQIPVEMAFFFRNSALERVVAFYPSPMGATESRLDLGAWQEIERANPALRTLEDDVEALLVNRAGSRHGYWLVPVDDCYRLVAVIRTRWRGFSGGKEVWTEIDSFFHSLAQRAKPYHSPSAAIAPEPQLERS
jgi:hypothetical protein